MYREPHLQKKSDECAKIWYDWYHVKYVLRDNELADTLRKKWCQCAHEHGEMVSQEVKTNPRYKQIELFPGKKEPPR